jgi:nitroreductase
MLEEIIKKNRSYRRFHEPEKITADQLIKWISLTRYCSSGRNMQSLKYIGITKPEIVSDIFPHLAWAGYLPEWNGPAEGERPVAYIALLHDKGISEKYYCDDGIALQTILLGATADGFGGCIFGSFNRAKLTKLLRLPENLEILWIIALGKPSEKVVVEDLSNGDVRYWRDENSIHHVPKRKAEELIVRIE